MSKEIQLAIQGGGAKICYLLAAMEAVQALHRGGTFRVTRVAGTSAGAIVGALFAADVSIEAFRKELAAGLGDRLVGLFKAPPLKSVLYHLWRGSPFWEEEELKKVLDAQFRETKIRRVGDFKSNQDIEMLIVASSLSDARRAIAPDDQFIANALVDSAGIPFCFRGWKGPNPRIVDGGICNNFPWEELQQGTKGKGEIVGISFKPRRPADPGNLLRFAGGLLGAAMDNAMEQARLRLSADGNAIFMIDADIDTFDFENALKFLKSGEYTALRERADKFFRQLGQRPTGTIVVNWAEQNQTMMLKLGQIYKVQHHKNDLSYDRCSVEILANSLLDQGDEPDLVTYSVTFRTQGDAVHCYRVTATRIAENDMIDETKTSWEIVGDTGRIEIICLPMKDPGDEKERQLLFSFNPVLEAQSGPYTLTFNDFIPGALRDLKTVGSDEVSFTATRSAANIGRVDLVLYVPKAYREAQFHPKNPLEPGRKMTVAELAAYNCPPGFEKMGWTGQGLEGNKPFGINIKISQPALIN